MQMLSIEMKVEHKTRVVLVVDCATKLLNVFSKQQCGWIGGHGGTGLGKETMTDARSPQHTNARRTQSTDDAEYELDFMAHSIQGKHFSSHSPLAGNKAPPGHSSAQSPSMLHASSPGTSQSPKKAYRVQSTNSIGRVPVHTLDQSVEVDKFTFRRQGFEDALLISRFEDMLTVGQSWRRAARKFGSAKCMGTRNSSSAFTWYTYAQIDKRIHRIVCALVHLGGTRGNHVIWSENCVEFHMACLALAQVKGAVSVPLAAKAHDPFVTHVLHHAEPHTIFCSQKCLDRIISRELLPSLHHSVKRIICFDPLTHNQKQLIKKHEALFSRITLLQFDHLDTLGSEHKKPRSQIDAQAPQDITSIHYTSATEHTNPRGALITNINMLSAVSSLHHSIGGASRYTLTDASPLSLSSIEQQPHTYLSYYSPAYVHERCCTQLMFDTGSAVGFWSGDIRSLKKDFESLQPTLINASAHVCEIIARLVHRTIMNSKLLRLHFFSNSSQNPYNSNQNHISKWRDLLVHRQLRKRLGGRLTCIISTGSPLPESTQTYLRKSLNIPILQTYGLTETCCAGTMQLHNDLNTGTVGAPLPCVELRLRSCPKLDFFVTDSPPRGEILIRGPSVCAGYWKERPLNTFAEDGWFHTGDIAKLNLNGSFSIIDRRSNFLQLGTTGEYIAVGKLEQQYEQHPVIHRMYIHVSERHDSLVAVAIVNLDALIKLGQERGFQTEYLDSKDVQRSLLEELHMFAQIQNLEPHQLVRNIRLKRSNFSEMSNILETSDRKMRREQLETFFNDELEEMFSEIEEF